jgi:hypothetical protein
MIHKKVKIVLIAIMAILMLMVVQAKGQEFKIGSFKDHISLQMDNSVDPILKKTAFIQWYGEKDVLKNEYGFTYNYSSTRNAHQFEFLSIKEYKRFIRKNGPITIEFLDANDEILYSVDVISNKTVTGKDELAYHFIYSPQTQGVLKASVQ